MSKPVKLALSCGPDVVHVMLEAGVVSVRVDYARPAGAAPVVFELPEAIAKLLPSAMMSAFAAQAFTSDVEEPIA
jgi:hypothetical protein